MKFELQNKIWILSTVALLALVGCDNMRDNNHTKPYEATPFFEDGSTSRGLVEGTVPRGFLREDDHLYRGKTAGGAFSENFPFPVTASVLQRGRERYDIYCIVCHGVTGRGDGMVVRRGYNKPEPFQSAKLKAYSPGALFDVITNGTGVMAPFKNELVPEDRWAVAAYIQTLRNIKETSPAPAESKTV